MDLPKNRIPLAIGAAAAGVLAIAMVTVVWPALMRPEPPLERAGDDGLRISVVEPPKAPTRASSLLDVGVSDAVQAMVKGREALFDRPPSVTPRLPAPRPSVAPVRVVVQPDESDNAMPPPERSDDRWERDSARRDRFEEARNRRWEEERLAQEARDEHTAWEREASARRRWEDERDHDRYDDRAAPPPYEERGQRRERW